jgi:hypothetical protein
LERNIEEESEEKYIISQTARNFVNFFSRRHCRRKKKRRRRRKRGKIENISNNKKQPKESENFNKIKISKREREEGKICAWDSLRHHAKTISQSPEDKSHLQQYQQQQFKRILQFFSSIFLSSFSFLSPKEISKYYNNKFSLFSKKNFVTTQIIIVGLLSLCSVTVSSQVSRAQNISNLVAQIVSPADPFNSTPIYLNESWWPTNIPLELYHSNRGTLQQQIIGVPPSWGVGCPTPGNTPPVRGISSSSDDNNNTISDNKLNRETKLEQKENDNSPYYSCPAPCPLTTTINNIKMDSVKFNSPSFKNDNDDDDVYDSSTNSYSSKPINQEQKGEQKFKHPPYFNQCLHYLQPSVFETLCKKDNQSIYEFGRKISKLRLPFCCEHTVESVVMASLQQPDFNVMIEEVDDFNNEVPVSLLRNFECIRHLESLLTLDRLARKAAAMFDSVLERYDCGQTYSVNFRCEDCKVRIICSDYK